MNTCIHCGAEVMIGVASCPECRESLTPNGSSTALIGYLALASSLVPLAIGAVSRGTAGVVALGLGGATFVAGVALIRVGNARVAEWARKADEKREARAKEKEKGKGGGGAPARAS